MRLPLGEVKVSNFWAYKLANQETCDFYKGSHMVKWHLDVEICKVADKRGEWPLKAYNWKSRQITFKRSSGMLMSISMSSYVED